MENKNENLFRSSFFRKLFLSYVLLILFALGLFCVWYLHTYNEQNRTAVREESVTVQCMRSRDPVTEGYEGVATGKQNP